MPTMSRSPVYNWISGDSMGVSETLSTDREVIAPLFRVTPGWPSFSANRLFSSAQCAFFAVLTNILVRHLHFKGTDRTAKAALSSFVVGLPDSKAPANSTATVSNGDRCPTLCARLVDRKKRPVRIHRIVNADVAFLAFGDAVDEVIDLA